MYEAEDKLYALKQGTDSLHIYIAKFERILYEAHGGLARCQQNLYVSQWSQFDATCYDPAAPHGRLARTDQTRESHT